MELGYYYYFFKDEQGFAFIKMWGSLLYHFLTCPLPWTCLQAPGSLTGHMAQNKMQQIANNEGGGESDWRQSSANRGSGLSKTAFQTPLSQPITGLGARRAEWSGFINGEIMRLSTQWKPSWQRGSSFVICERGWELSSSVVRLKCIKVAFSVGAAKQWGAVTFSPNCPSPGWGKLRSWSKGKIEACPGVASVLAPVSRHSLAAQFLTP